MLLVLMTSTVMIMGVSILARARSSSALATLQASKLQLCHQLIQASEGPTLYWLNELAGSVVTDPDQSTSMVGVLDTHLEIDRSRIRIQITAWDQHGMWPSNFDTLETRAVPVRREVARPQSDQDGLGLTDQVYPTMSNPISQSSLMSTHNPWPTQQGRTRRGSLTAINVNTSPRELLSQLSPLFDGLWDLEELIEQRKRGEFVTVSQSMRVAAGEEVRLVSMSHCWSIRTQITVDGITRGTWSVYANQRGHWELVQRKVIDESIY